jgi:hypothetical protein
MCYYHTYIRRERIVVCYLICVSVCVSSHLERFIVTTKNFTNELTFPQFVAGQMNSFARSKFYTQEGKETFVSGTHEM